jgi:hypothetical protein
LYERVLERFRQLVQSGQYVMTIHAQEEMEDDGLTVFDVESGLLTGAIVERQRDRKTGEWKYLVEGLTLAGAGCVVVGKITPVDKLAILTVYALQG